MRIETINSEEQRAYIEVLKAALESKINDLGLMNFIKETAKYSKTNHLDLFVHFQKLKENIDNQGAENSTKETRILEMEALIDHQQNELSQLKITNQELMDFNVKINNDIENTIKGLNLLDEENKKLKNEKAHVLDYLDEITKKSEKLQQALDDAIIRLQEKDDFISNLQREISSLHKHIQLLENPKQNDNSYDKKSSFPKNNPTNNEQVADLLKELETLKRKYQDLINRPIIMSSSQNDEKSYLQHENDVLAKENKALHFELERLQKREKRDPSFERRDPLESTLSSTQERIVAPSPNKEKLTSPLERSLNKEQMEAYKKENDVLKKENEQLKLQNSYLIRNMDENQRRKTPPPEKKDAAERELDKLTSENRELKRKLHDFELKTSYNNKKTYRKPEETQTKLNEDEKNEGQLRSPSKEEPEREQKSNISKRSAAELMENDTILEDLKGRLEREREQKSKEIKEIYDSLSNTRSELREAKEEITSQQLKIENLENDINTYKDLNEKKQKLIEQNGQEVLELKKFIDSKNNEINGLNKKMQIDANEIQELQKMIAHWEKQLKNSNGERESLLKEMKELSDENYRAKNNIKELNYKLDENKKVNAEINERVKDYENKLKALQNNMRNMVQGIRREILENKKGKLFNKSFDENAGIEEVLKEIKESFNAMIEENDKLNKNNKEMQENLKENEQSNLRKYMIITKKTKKNRFFKYFFIILPQNRRHEK